MKNKKLATTNTILPPAFDSGKVLIPPMLPPPSIENPSEEELDALKKLREDMDRIEKENQMMDMLEWEEENAPTLIKDLKSKKMDANTLLKLCTRFYNLSKR